MLESPDFNVVIHCDKLDHKVKLDAELVNGEYVRVNLGWGAAVMLSPVQARELIDRLAQTTYEYELLTGQKLEYMPKTQKEATA